MKIKTQIAAITLADGRHLGVFDFYVRATYGLMLAGKPSKQLNETVLGHMATQAQDWWQDEHEALVLRPGNGELETQLPAYLMMALLNCSTPLSPEYHGSMLRVVWFSQELPKKLTQFLEEHLGRIDWKNNAKDYFI